MPLTGARRAVAVGLALVLLAACGSTGKDAKKASKRAPAAAAAVRTRGSSVPAPGDASGDGSCPGAAPRRRRP